MKYISKDNLYQYDELIKNYISDKASNIQEILAYGVQWSEDQADPHLTRIGNMTMHKTLPIQNNMKGVIAQKFKVMYYLDENDWRWRATPLTVDLTITDNTIVNDLFSTKQYEKQWLRIGTEEVQVINVDTATKTATLDKTPTLIGEQSVELGAVLNGYDGTVRVKVPRFWIKAYIDGNIRQVWISPTYIDASWTEQPSVLVDAYRSTVLNVVPENMGFLSTLPVNSAISVVNTNAYCRGGGNRSDYDQYLVTDSFRTDLGKPRTNISRATMRTYSRNAKSQMLSYDQYKNIFYWLYVIEYANFNSQEAYNATLTDEGYRQGGMGASITTMDKQIEYNGYHPLTPCGYGNTLGNGTGLVSLTIPEFTYGADSTVRAAQTMQMARWRGFDNPFGDFWTNLDGIIIDADANNHPNNMNYVYTCQDASKYADTLNDSYVKVGEEIHQDGYTKSFDLGDAAHIIPHVMGGDTTKYICDYHWTGDKNKTLRTLLVGGDDSNGALAGLGYFHTYDSVSRAWENVGFRSVSGFMSFSSDK